MDSFYVKWYNPLEIFKLRLPCKCFNSQVNVYRLKFVQFATDLYETDLSPKALGKIDQRAWKGWARRAYCLGALF